MRRAVVAAVSLLGLAGCDPYTRAGMWQPSGANDRNLVAMVARPSDLLRGHGEARPQSDLAAVAVRRLLTGHPVALPSLSADADPGSAPVGAVAAPVSSGSGVGSN